MIHPKKIQSRGVAGPTKSHLRFSASGRRVGESHPLAKLSDHEVDLIREIADDWRAEKRTLRDISTVLARKFGVHPRTVVKYIYCELRAQTIEKIR